jgi:hypothetical protein
VEDHLACSHEKLVCEKILEFPTSKGDNQFHMTTACPCFGGNENCRFCGGSGFVSSEGEVEAVRYTKPTYFSGQSETQKRVESENKKNSEDISFMQERRRAAISLAAAEKRRQVSEQEAKVRQEAAEKDVRDPFVQLALKLKAEQDLNRWAEQAKKDEAQTAKSIAYWNKRWGVS